MKSTTKPHLYYWRARYKVLQMLGGKCRRCGITDIRVLQINHKSGGGTKEYRQSGGADLASLILQGRRKVNDLELLCANCNILYEYERNKRHLPPISDLSLRKERRGHSVNLVGCYRSAYPMAREGIKGWLAQHLTNFTSRSRVLISVREAAKLLGISPQTIYIWGNSGKIKRITQQHYFRGIALHQGYQGIRVMVDKGEITRFKKRKG